MEYNASLMIGFVKRLKILDQEFRSTDGAMDYAKKQWGNDQEAMSKALSETIRKQVQDHQRPAKDALQTLSGAVEQMIQDETSVRAARQEELVRCRELLATIRAAEMSVLHQQELGGQNQADADSSVTLATVLTGEPDFAKLAVEVNQTYRAGKTGKAKRAYAQFQSKAKGAKAVLDARINALNGEFAGQMTRRREELAFGWTDGAEKMQAQQKQTAQALEQEQSQWASRIRENADRSRFAKMELDMKRSDRDMRIRSSFQMQYSQFELEEEYNRVHEAAPVRNGYTCRTTMPPMAYLGDMELGLSGLGLTAQSTAFLNRNYPFLQRNRNLVMPYGVPFGKTLNSRFSYTEAERVAAVQEAKNLALRLFMMCMPGKLRMTFADPVTLGDSFAVFSQLVYDREEDNVINGRIWASPSEIHRQLERVIEHISDVTQRCLQGRYASLEEYNRDAFDPEGYHVLMLMDYPAGMTKASLELLERIVRLGPKCGVFTILMRSETQYQKAPAECRALVDQLEGEFRKWQIRQDLRVVFEDQKLPGQDIFFRSGTDLNQEEMDNVLTELRMGIPPV